MGEASRIFKLSRRSRGGRRSARRRYAEAATDLRVSRREGAGAFELVTQRVVTSAYRSDVPRVDGLRVAEAISGARNAAVLTAN